MPEPPLAMERDALRHVLKRLMTEVNDLETLCKHGPRIVSVATNTARVQAALENANEPDAMDEIRKTLAELADGEDQEW